MKLVDGVMTLHQSDISQYMKCPEQFRLANGISPNATWNPPDGGRVESDAATVGTVLHGVIEQDLIYPFDTLEKANSFGRQYLGSLITGYVEDGVEYRTESFGADPQVALRELGWLIESWYKSAERTYWLERDPKTFLIESFFDVPFVKRPGREICEVRLAGTPDLVDLQENRVVDWKSASRPYQRWEYQRWGIQPTAYTFAAADQGLIEPNGDGLYKFDYRIFIKGKKLETQGITVLRGPGQWGWLTQVVNNIADLAESDATVWPLRDDGWWCGPRWCPIWTTCKGMFVDEEWT